jgi:hypothetical protein
LVFLGTVAGKNNFGNSSGIYINIPGDDNVMCNSQINFDTSHGILLDYGDASF